MKRRTDKRKVSLVYSDEVSCAKLIEDFLFDFVDEAYFLVFVNKVYQDPDHPLKATVPFLQDLVKLLEVDKVNFYNLMLCVQHAEERC